MDQANAIHPVYLSMVDDLPVMLQHLTRPWRDRAVCTCLGNTGAAVHSEAGKQDERDGLRLYDRPPLLA